jgi:Spy/CpxP family protein refolding chaperone
MFTFILGGLLEAAPAHANDAKAVDAEADAPKAAAPKADSAKAPIPGGPNDIDALWWNDPKIVKSLSLTVEQRGKMTKHLKAYHEKVPRDRKPEEFQEALVQGDWKAARDESDQLAKNAATAVRMRGTLKIDVLSLLSKKQRETLVDRYPRLIYKPWRRAMRGGSSR